MMFHEKCLKTASFLAVFCSASALADPPPYHYGSLGPGVSPTGISNQATERAKLEDAARCEDRTLSSRDDRMTEPSARRHHHARMQGGTKGSDDPCEQAGHAEMHEEEVD